MSELSSPPVPAEADLRHFKLFPLDCVRFWESETLALCSGDELRAAIMLWTKSWHQVPAGSLPNEDRLLCHLAGLGRDLAGFNAVRSVAMRGWYLCDDGRLYHDVIAEAVNHNWKITSSAVKHAARMRQAKAEKAKGRQQPVTGNPMAPAPADSPSLQEPYKEPLPSPSASSAASAIASSLTSTLTSIFGKPIEKGLDQALLQPLGNRKEEIGRKKESEPNGSESVDLDLAFDRFWSGYPNKQNKPGSRQKFAKKLAAHGLPPILAGLEKWNAYWTAEATEKRFIPYPAVWLNQERFFNDPPPRRVTTNGYFEAERLSRENDHEHEPSDYNFGCAELAGPSDADASGDFEPLDQGGF